jgi:ATP-dependent DNA ligase
MRTGSPCSSGCGASRRARVFLYAFDLLELNGTDLRREPLETRKATLASLLRGSFRGCA